MFKGLMRIEFLLLFSGKFINRLNAHVQLTHYNRTVCKKFAIIFFAINFVMRLLQSLLEAGSSTIYSKLA